MAIEKINANDTLNQGRTKINNVIDALANNNGAISIGFSETFNTLEDLKSKYPSGADGAFLVFNNGNNDGSHVYIFKDNAWTDFGIYQATAIADNSIDRLKIKENAITYDKTNFLENDETKNLFDGNYIDGYSISGSGSTDGYYYVKRELAKTAEIKIRPNTTYKLFRETPSRLILATSTKRLIGNAKFDGKIAQNWAGTGVTDTPKTLEITTGLNDNYLYVNTSVNGTEPFLRVVEGNLPDTETYRYEIKPKSEVDILSKSEYESDIYGIDKVDFVKKINLFDGNYLKDTSITGSEPYPIINTTGGQTAEIKIKPNTTYYIGREIPSRFNLGTATSQKTFGKSLDGKIRLNYSGSGETSSPEILKITTGPNDNYLYINNSLNNENKFLLVTENEINSVGSFDYNRAVLDKNIEIPNVQNQKSMRVIYNGTDNLKIYIPSKKTNLFVCYEYLKVDDDATNMHQWRVQNTYIVNNDLSVKYKLDNQTEWEGAIKEVGASDYMGGQHGDERNVAISFNFDGKQYDMSQAFEFDVFNEIKIISHSILNRADHPGDDLLKRVKISTWNLDEYKVENIYTALQSFEIFESKLTLMSCRYNDNLTSDVLVNKARRDVEYTDVAISSASVGSLGNETKDAHLIEMWGDNLYFSARCEAEYERYPNRKQLIQNFSGEAIPRAKIYFDITGNYSINKNEVLKNKSTYRLIV